MTAAEISENMKLHDIKSHSWHIQVHNFFPKTLVFLINKNKPCSVLKNEGIKEGLDWLTEQILENSKSTSN